MLHCQNLVLGKYVKRSDSYTRIELQYVWKRPNVGIKSYISELKAFNMNNTGPCQRNALLIEELDWPLPPIVEHTSECG